MLIGNFHLFFVYLVLLSALIIVHSSTELKSFFKKTLWRLGALGWGNRYPYEYPFALDQAVTMAESGQKQRQPSWIKCILLRLAEQNKMILCSRKMILQQVSHIELYIM